MIHIGMFGWLILKGCFVIGSLDATRQRE